MKAEERHRLQENDLHRLAEQARERSRPFFDRYGVAILLGLAAILIVIAAVVWWSKRQAADRGEGWAALAAAFRDPDATAESFAAVADSFPESDAAQWARLYEGESRLGTGLESLFSDKDGAVRDLDDAKVAFETVLEKPNLDKTIAVRALYGLARSLEAGSDGDLKPAIDRYEQIVADYAGTVYEPLAASRLESLKSSGASEFYTWFSKAKPTLQDPLMRPQDGSSPLPGMISPGASPDADGPIVPGLDFPTGGGPAMVPPGAAPTDGSATESISPDEANSGSQSPAGTAVEGSSPAVAPKPPATAPAVESPTAEAPNATDGNPEGESANESSPGGPNLDAPQ